MAQNRATALCFDDINTGYAGYVGEVNGYLANTATPINQSSYAAALFWTYVVEKFGTSSVGDAVEGGMNLMSEFWKQSAANPKRDGIAVLNSTLQALGTSMRFRDVWKDFAVANYAKNLTGTGVQPKYQYADMAQPGGNYNPVSFRVDQALALNTPFLRIGETVYPWAAHYYRFTPAADVPVIDIRVTQDTSTPLYYTVMGVRNNNVLFEYNVEARNLNQTLINNAFTEVVVIVAGLENLANYRVAVNSTQPTLHILSPTNTTQARVGDFTAPEKFRVVVQLLAGDGTPLTGVDLNNFNFRVGTKDVTNDLVIARSKIQDQQWFVLRAPVQDATGIYDLHVNYANNATLSVTNTQAVNYAPRVSADNMLIIDRSGSMGGAKLDAAKKAARLYVDSWRVGDKLGVVGYDHNAVLNMTMQDWTDPGTRQTAFTAINGLTAGGATAIGDALTMGFNEITAKGDASHDWALILLSDGIEEGDVTVDFPTAINNIAGAAGKRPVIHAIAIGPNADGPRMQNAATATGGTYQFVSEPTAMAAGADVDTAADAAWDENAEIAEGAALRTIEGINNPDAPAIVSNRRLDLNLRYRYIASDVLGHQQNFTAVGPIYNYDDDIYTPGNEGDERTIRVEGSAAEISISLSFASNCAGCRIELVDPNNTTYPRANTQDKVTSDPNGLHYVWRIATPIPGNWKLRVYYRYQGPKVAGVDSPDQTGLVAPYLIQTAIKSDLLFDAALPVPVADRVTGTPMPIVATLTDLGPVTGAGVWAYVTNPYGAETPLTLWDDGLHGDGEAGDGVYANTYYQTGFGGTMSGAGSYMVEVFASGSTLNTGSFSRQKLLGFYMYGGDSDGNGDGWPDGDVDNDGIPDAYEELHTGSPTALDPTADDDGDGLSNADEWLNGTDPFNADSDGGGESDGSEVFNGKDPNDPSDDNIEPTWTVAYPGDSKVFVRYAPRADYDLLEIHRSSEGFTGTYLFLDQIPDPGGMYTDTSVMNDQEYCYYVIGIKGSGEQSARLTPSCATPKLDPWPPEGGFLINGGASRTSSVNVTLNIFASDSVSPHAHADAFDEIMEPLASSATSVTHMRISNNGDMSGSTFVPYSDQAAWTLAQTSGLATVYMQFQDEARNVSRIVANSIEVDQSTPIFNDTLVMPFLRR